MKYIQSRWLRYERLAPYPCLISFVDVPKTCRRALEALVISAVTCSIGFALMFFSEVSECSGWKLRLQMVRISFTPRALTRKKQDCLPLDDLPAAQPNPLQFFCKERQYNAMASLIFNTPEESIKNLFHNPSNDFQIGTLGMFFLAYFCLSCVTYGVAVPSGLFVPCILTGASWGRLMGNILMHYFPGRTWVEVSFIMFAPLCKFHSEPVGCSQGSTH